MRLIFPRINGPNVLIMNSNSSSNPNLVKIAIFRRERSECVCCSQATFRPEHLKPSFTTMNKFILVTCEYSRYLISSLLVLTKSIQIFLTFTGVARVNSAVNLTPFFYDEKHRQSWRRIKLKTSVDKSYMDTQFRFGYFRQLAPWERGWSLGFAEAGKLQFFVISIFK